MSPFSLSVGASDSVSVLFEIKSLEVVSLESSQTPGARRALRHAWTATSGLWVVVRAQPRSDTLSRRRAVARLWLLPGVSKCPLQSWQRHGLDGERRREGYDCRILVSYQFGRKQEHRVLGARKCTIWDPCPCHMSLPSAPPRPPPVAHTSMQLVNFPHIVDLTFRILPGTSSRSKWSRLLWR